MVNLYPGVQLTVEDETQLRRLVHTLQRAGSPLADRMARFLPEREIEWTDEDRHAVRISFAAKVPERDSPGD